LFAAGTAVSYAALVLTLFPGSSARLFAWDIQPPVTAAFMGAFYASAIPLLFLMSRRGTRWEMVRPLLPGLFTLSAAMLVATALHADRFIWSNAVAWAWLILYILYPPAIVAMYVDHVRRSPPDPSPDRPVAAPFRALALTVAIASAAIGLALMVDPGSVAGLWPWELTPLTGRVVGGWLLFLAAGSASAAREREWRAIRGMLPQAVLVMVLLLIGAVRFRDELDWSSPRGWAYLAALAFGMVAISAVYARYERSR
jgi:hypothetical protein